VVAAAVVGAAVVGAAVVGAGGAVVVSTTVVSAPATDTSEFDSLHAVSATSAMARPVRIGVRYLTTM
jgi:hypothetical protein